jgi:hypothetical protein
MDDIQDPKIICDVNGDFSSQRLFDVVCDVAYPFEAVGLQTLLFA